MYIYIYLSILLLSCFVQVFTYNLTTCYILKLWDRHTNMAGIKLTNGIPTLPILKFFEPNVEN